MSETRMLPIDSIRIDGGTQFRVTLSQPTIDDYAEAIGEGVEFPAVVVFEDGDAYWLADGFHRHAAYRRAGKTEIPAEVRAGGLRAAVLHSLSANRDHGLRRTNDDKRKAVVFALRDPELRKLSQHKIAAMCGVTQAMVSKVNRDLVPATKKGDNDYHFDTPESIRDAMNEEDRSVFLQNKLQNASFFYDQKVRKQYERWGLITSYDAGRIEWTPMSAGLFKLLTDGDTWLELERALVAYNDTLAYPDKHSIHRYRMVKPLLEALEKAAGWVERRELEWQAWGWARLLAVKGYALRGEVKPEDKHIRWSEREYFHITADGCRLLGLPYAYPIKPLPTVEEIERGL
jgi:hypothetical protein